MTEAPLNPPTISRFLRCPEDARLLRWWLERNAGRRILYIGPAFGQDFYSMLCCGFGISPPPQWSTAELDEIAYDALDDPVLEFLKVRRTLGDFEPVLLARRHDVIIANYCWRPVWDGQKKRRLAALLSCGAELICCRDAVTMKYEPAARLEFKAICAEAGYRALRYQDPIDFNTDACKRRDTCNVLLKQGAELPADIYLALSDC